MLLMLVEDAKKIGSQQALSQWLSRGQPLPTFGQPLYPEGDPRAASLLAQFRPSDMFAEICSVAEAMTGELPNIDFALGRVVGWIAHSLEQIETGRLIRPRAQYIGPKLKK